MKNVKININRSKLKEEEINAHEDFNLVLTKYNKAMKPLYKSPKFYLSIAVAGIILIAVLKMVDNPQGNNKTTITSFINPPLKDVNIEYKRFVVDPTIDEELEYKTGSVIKIAANSLVDEKGASVKGKVEISYREFHDPLDFFISGIPMIYDSAGIQYHFESAGMFEILAFQDGKPLSIKPDSPINIKMASFQSGNQYNIYQLDTSNKRWNYISKDVVQSDINYGAIDSAMEKKPVKVTLNKLVKESNAIKEDIAKIEDEKPCLPIKANNEKYNFDLEVDFNEFPEVAYYKGVRFEITDENKDFDPKLASITWENVLIKKNPQKELSYLVTFTRGNESHTFFTKPVVDEKNYPSAMKKYETKYKQYETRLAKRKDDELKKQEQLALQLKKFEEERIAQIKIMEQERLEREKRLMATMDTENKIFRTFQISNFGVWNSDCPSSLPQGNRIAARFYNKNNINLNLNKVYLVEKGRNAVFTYYNSYFQIFQYNPNAENILWGVTDDNKIAVFTTEDFKNMSKPINKYDFNMQVIDKTFTSIEEIKQFFKIDNI